MADYRAYFAIEKQLKSAGFKQSREDYIRTFTNCKKQGLSQLSPWEYKEFLNWLKTAFQQHQQKTAAETYNSPENQMRRKIISLLKHKMGYSYTDIDEWCIKYSPQHKPMQQHNYQELTVLVTQAERAYQSYIKNL